MKRCVSSVEDVSLKKPKLSVETDELPPRTSVASQQQPLESSQTTSDWHYDKSACQLFKQHSVGLNLEYFPRFFKLSDARSILKLLEKELPPYLNTSKNEVKIMGKIHKIPRKQAAFGDTGLSYNFSGVSVPANPWIPALKELRDILVMALGENFNFVLVNHYKDGHDHIGEHRDDENDLVPQASIASLSFGQERDFVFKHRDSRRKDAKRRDIGLVKICLGHGSLLVMKYPTNTHWYHSLPIRKSALRPRINLTFRVMKTPPT